MVDLARPACFERLERSAVALGNAMAGHRVLFEWQRYDSAVQLELRAGPAPVATELRLQFRDHRGALQIQAGKSLFRSLCTPWDGSTAVEALPLPLVRALLSPLLDWIGELLEMDLSVPTTEGGADTDSIALGLWDTSTAGEEPVATLSCGADRADQLLAAIAALPARASQVDPRRLSTDIELNIGYTSLAAAEYRDLAAGDILLLPPQLRTGEQEILLRHTGRVLASATLAGERSLVISRRIDGAVHTTYNERPMNDDYDDDFDPEQLDDDFVEEDAIPGATPPAAAPPDLEVRLDFNLGSLSLPLSAVEELREGYCLELDMPAQGQVDVTSGGRRIAVGELVQIEDRLGVRITRITDHANG